MIGVLYILIAVIVAIFIVAAEVHSIENDDDWDFVDVLWASFLGLMWWIVLPIFFIGLAGVLLSEKIKDKKCTHKPQ